MNAAGPETGFEPPLPPAVAVIPGVRRAVIDIGTNSIKMLVAEVDQAGVRPVLETSEQTRLGRAFYQTHRLQPAAIEASVRVVGRFASEAKALGANSIRLIATSAVRDAQNADELTSGINQATGLPVEIITGEQEADYVFAGVTSDPKLAGHPLLILDAGGGSTEFILGWDGHQHFRQSFHLGTVRLLEKTHVSDPPAAAELAACREAVTTFLKGQVHPALSGPLSDLGEGALRFVGTGGTPVILARMHLGIDSYDRERIQDTHIKAADVEAMTARLWSMTLEERRQVRGLPPERADVILAGAAIYAGVMEVFGLGELEISTRGLRFAVVSSLASNG